MDGRSVEGPGTANVLEGAILEGKTSLSLGLGFEVTVQCVKDWVVLVTFTTMRNLTLSTVQVSILRADDVIQFASPTSDNVSAVLSAIAFDLDRNVVFAGTESSHGEISIWRTSDSIPPTSGNGSFVFCGSYTSQDARIASLRVLAESNQLVLVTLAGDIVVWELDESGGFTVSYHVVPALLLTVCLGRY